MDQILTAADRRHGCVFSSRGDSAGECISLPPRMQAWLKGEGVSRAWRVAGEAVGLRGKAFQSRGGVSLEREFQQKSEAGDIKAQLLYLSASACAYLQKS